MVNFSAFSLNFYHILRHYIQGWAETTTRLSCSNAESSLEELYKLESGFYGLI